MVNNSVEVIPVAELAAAFVPVIIVLVIVHRFSLGSGAVVYAVARMVIQLLLVGYVLAYIFEANQASSSGAS